MKIRQRENRVLRGAGPLLLLCLLASLLVLPAPEASGSGSPAAWSLVPLPQAGQAGHWTLSPGTSLRHLTRATDGTLYAATDGATQALFRSGDGGLTWTLVKTLPDPVVAFIASPVEAAVLYYATADTVFRSADGGASFVTLPAAPGGAGQDNRRITSLAVTRAEGWAVAVGVTDDDPGDFGGVWTMSEVAGTFTWEDTGAGSVDVLAVAFSPYFPADRQLAAVATDGTDTFAMFRSGNLPWHAMNGPAVFHPDNGATSVVITSAVLTFSPSVSGTPVLFAGIADGAGHGDVYLVSLDSGLPSVADLDIGLGSGLADLDVGALSAAGTYPEVTILAGASASSNIFTSRDAGTSWEPAVKPPPGTSVTSLLAPDGLAAPPFAATSGPGGSLSRSSTDALSWDQVSFIDTTIDALVDLAPSPAYESDGTLFLLTFGSGIGSLWRTRNEGTSWERVFWTGAAGVDSLAFVAVSPGYGAGSRTVYCAGTANGAPAVWKSSDGGGAFDLHPTLDPSTGTPFPVDAWAVTGDDTLFIAGFNGASSLVYRTDTAGYYYSPGVAAGNQPVTSLAVTGDGPGLAVLAGSDAGRVYLSRDNGLTFQPLPASGPVGLPSAPVDAVFDAGFAANGIVYAAAAAPDSGAYRFRTATGPAWEAIDTTLPAGGAVTHLAVGPDGVLYGADNAANLGVERSLEPARSNPSFVTVTRALPDGAVLGGLWQSGNSIWSFDTAHDRLLLFNDTLTRPVAADLPEDAAVDCGTVTGHTITSIRLSWASLPGATGYEWQCASDSSFAGLVTGMSGTTSGRSVDLPALQPAATYYWRLRASSPAPGPWSAPRTFTTRLVTDTVILQPDLPAPGATDVAFRPLFQWTAVVGADAYELLVAADGDFSSPVIARQGTDALPTNAWAADVGLAPATTYYWKVRALTAGAASDWSATGIFTTAATAAEEPSPSPTAAAPETPEGTSPTASAPAIQPYAPAAPTTTVIATPGAITVSPAPVTVLYDPEPVPAWLLYTIGGVLVALVLILAVLLVVVLRFRGR